MGRGAEAGEEDAKEEEELMPLPAGVKNFDRNVREMMRANRRRKKKRTRAQILAIAYAAARRSIRKRKTKHRRSR